MRLLRVGRHYMGGKKGLPSGLPLALGVLVVLASLVFVAQVCLSWGPAGLSRLGHRCRGGRGRPGIIGVYTARCLTLFGIYASINIAETQRNCVSALGATTRDSKA